MCLYNVSCVCGMAFQCGRSMNGQSTAPVPLGRIYFPIVDDRDEFSNREQSETNRNDENAMCYSFTEYLRMCLP